MTIAARVLHLGLPLDNLVVIGSGLLDVLDLRASRDIDLVVNGVLFDELKDSGKYTCAIRHDEEVLERDDVEIWRSWGAAEAMSFDSLYKNSVVIEGIHFCHPQTVLEWKRHNDWPKDRGDVALLETYLDLHPTKFS